MKVRTKAWIVFLLGGWLVAVFLLLSAIWRIIQLNLESIERMVFKKEN